MIEYAKKNIIYWSSGWRRTIITISLLVLSMLIINRIFILEGKTLSSIEWKLQLQYILPASLMFIVNYVLALYAWHLLIKHFTSYNEFYISSKIYMRSNLSKRIPTPIAYTADRVLAYQEYNVSGALVTFITILELLLFFLSALIVIVITLPFWSIDWSQLQQLFYLTLLLPLLLFIPNPKFLNRLLKFILKDEMIPIEILWKNILSWLGIYIVTWLVGAFTVFLLINVGFAIEIQDILTLTGMWASSSALSMLGTAGIAGFGVREITLGFLLFLLIPDTAIVTSIVVTIRIVWLFGEIIGGIISLIM